MASASNKLSSVAVRVRSKMSRVAESGATWQGSLLIETATDSVRVQHHFASNGKYKIEQIELGDGSIHSIDDFVIV